MHPHSWDSRNYSYRKIDEGWFNAGWNKLNELTSCLASLFGAYCDLLLFCLLSWYVTHINGYPTDVSQVNAFEWVVLISEVSSKRKLVHMQSTCRVGLCSPFIKHLVLFTLAANFCVFRTTLRTGPAVTVKHTTVDWLTSRYCSNCRYL